MCPGKSKGKVVRTQKEGNQQEHLHSGEVRLELVRKWKDNKPERGTHSLEEVEVRTGQDMESKQASKGYSPTREGRGWDWWEHGKQAS